MGGPLLVVLSGPSGVGKDAVLGVLRARGLPWRFVVTATTRPRRPGEVDGRDYIFLSRDEFLRRLGRGGFLEHAQVYGHLYGVPRDQVEEALSRGQDVLVKVDVQGARHIRRLTSGAVFIFLAPPSMEELERRLRLRHTESPETLRRRLEEAEREMKELPLFDYVVVNHSGRLEETARCVEAIVWAERCRYPPRRTVLR